MSATRVWPCSGLVTLLATVIVVLSGVLSPALPPRAMVPAPTTHRKETRGPRRVRSPQTATKRLRKTPTGVGT